MKRGRGGDETKRSVAKSASGIAPNNDGSPVELPVASDARDKFAFVAKQYSIAYEKLRRRQESFPEIQQSLCDDEAQKLRMKLFELSAKAIRHDPKLRKTKYEENYWKFLYPLLRQTIEDSDVLKTASTRSRLSDLLRLGHASFRCFIRVFLSRVGIRFTGFADLPRSCEMGLTEEAVDADKNHWIRSFLYRCLCCIGDIYRYGSALDQEERFLSAQYYRLAAEVRPADGRALSSLGIIHKEMGDILSAVYFYMLSACKKVPYEPYRNNLEALGPMVEELRKNIEDYGEENGINADQRQMAILSVRFLRLTQSFTTHDETGCSEFFAQVLDSLALSLKLPVPINGEWRDTHFAKCSYMHPEMLMRMCVVLFSMRFILEREGQNSAFRASFRAFLTTFAAQVFAFVSQSVQFWMDYTGFSSLPEPDRVEVFSCVERNRVNDRYRKEPLKAFLNGVVDEDFWTGLSNMANSEELSENFWKLVSTVLPDGDCGDHEENGTVGSSPYVDAFTSFLNTQPHLSTVHLLVQYLRYDEDLWTFCITNYPDMFRDFIDIFNKLRVPSFVREYFGEKVIEDIPSRKELLLREHVPLNTWLSELDWYSFYQRNGLSLIEEQMLVLMRLEESLIFLAGKKIARLDHSKRKFVCTLERRLPVTQKPTESRETKKLLTAFKLGQAWQAEEALREEREFMNRRADLPRYLVFDTSCFVRKLDWVKKLYSSKLFKFVIPSYVLQELDAGKSNKAYRDAIRWLDSTTVTQDRDRVEIQRWKDMHQHDVELETEWKKLTNSERSARVMVDCTKFFAEELRKRTEDSADYGLHIRMVTDLDLQSAYCVRVMEQMEKMDLPHEIKILRIKDLMGWIEEGPEYFRRMQESGKDF